MSNKNSFNFTKSIQEIEAILEQLEKSSEVDIAKNIELVEKGFTKIELCHKNLKKVENKVQELQVNFSKKTDTDVNQKDPDDVLF